MGKQERGLVCVFCGEGFGYSGETPDEDTLKAAVDHEKECVNNPYLAEIARLKNAIAAVKEWDCQQFIANNGKWTLPSNLREIIQSVLLEV